MIRCDGLDDLLDAAAVLAEQPTPRGGGVGIVCNARGPGVVCADACADAGLGVASLSAETQAALREILPPASVVAGPVQLVAAESPAGFRAAVEHVAADPAVDAVIAIFVEHIATGADEAAAALAAAAPALHAAGMPLLAVFMTPGPLPDRAARGADRPPRGRATRRGVKVPTFRAPEARRPRARPRRRVRALRAPRRAAEPPRARRRRRATPRPAMLAGVARARRRVAAAGRGRGAAGRLRDRAGRAAARRLGRRGREGRRRARRAGRAQGRRARASCTRRRRARCGSTSAARPRSGARRRRSRSGSRRPGTPVEDFLVQRMAGAGVEMLVGVLADERFGPVVACGAGGGTAEVLEDVAVRLAPLALEEAHDMIRGLRSRALLERARADVDALADIAVRVGALADAHPAIAELDLNPVMVGPDGARGGRRARAGRAARRPARVPGGRAMKRIGLLGGMSWESTIEYYRLVNELVARAPRRAALGRLPAAQRRLRRHRGAAARGPLGGGGRACSRARRRQLEAAGAELLVLCTNTMHKLAPQIDGRDRDPVRPHRRHDRRRGQARRARRASACSRPRTRWSRSSTSAACASTGSRCVVPDAADRRIVHDVIYEELCVGVVEDASREEYRRIMRALAAEGAQGILLGCTEIDLLVGAGGLAGAGLRHHPPARRARGCAGAGAVTAFGCGRRVCGIASAQSIASPAATAATMNASV